MPPKGPALTKPMNLSKELIDIVGKQKASHSNCIKLIWDYIKKHSCLHPNMKQYFIPDAKLAKIFGQDRVSVFGMARFLPAHMSPIKKDE